MKYLIKIGWGTLYTLISLLLLTFITTVLFYFGIIKENTLSIIEIIIIFLSMFLGGITVGRKSDKKGWIEGLKYSLIIILLLLVINSFIFKIKFEPKFLIYYLIISISIIFGSMLGINKKS